MTPNRRLWSLNALSLESTWKQLRERGRGSAVCLGAGSGLASPARPGAGCQFIITALTSVQIEQIRPGAVCTFHGKEPLCPCLWKLLGGNLADKKELTSARQFPPLRWPLCGSPHRLSPWAILGSVTPSGVRLEPLSWPPSCGAWTLQAGYQVPLEVLLQIWWGCPLVGS